MDRRNINILSLLSDDDNLFTLESSNYYNLYVIQNDGKYEVGKKYEPSQG
jgi:hypothetical protein